MVFHIEDKPFLYLLIGRMIPCGIDFDGIVGQTELQLVLEVDERHMKGIGHGPCLIMIEHDGVPMVMMATCRTVEFIFVQPPVEVGNAVTYRTIRLVFVVFRVIGYKSRRRPLFFIVHDLTSDNQFSNLLHRRHHPIRQISFLLRFQPSSNHPQWLSSALLLSV